MHKPGEMCNQTGRYKCSACGNTIILNKGNLFPPCSVCRRSGITWSLVTPLT
jgi:hypothetical protein